VRELKSHSRLLLTGTPLQNNLHELWALLNFLLPEHFADAEEFDALFQSSERAEHVTARLQRILRPFLLRRLKSDVEAGLPAKTQVRLLLSFTETLNAIKKSPRFLQKALYMTLIWGLIERFFCLSLCILTDVNACTHAYIHMCSAYTHTLIMQKNRTLLMSEIQFKRNIIIVKKDTTYTHTHKHTHTCRARACTHAHTHPRSPTHIHPYA